MDVLIELFRHNTMMNNRLLAACRQLSPEQLGATVVGTYGTIGATLVHIANSQTGYSARLLELERPESLLEDVMEGVPDFDTLAERMTLGNERLEQAAARGSSDKQVQVRGDDPTGMWWMPVSLYMLQAVNHATEHRSQIATILTQLGIEPPGMDGWAFFVDSGHMTPITGQELTATARIEDTEVT